MTNMRVIADNALEGRRNMIAGANKNDYHLRNVTPARISRRSSRTSVRWRKAIRRSKPASRWRSSKRVEIGHIFKLGYKYSDSMG